MYSQADLAIDLERALVKGFDVFRISKVAFEIYQNHGLEITAPMDRVLLTLMAMEEGEEFELTESEFLALISEIKAM
jgi:3-dehydroquinate dehydratase